MTSNLRHLLALLLATSLLAACNREAPAPADPASAEASPPADEAAAAPSPADAATDATGGDPVKTAFEQAAAQQRAVLVDFHAPWCYSCYFMAENVLVGTQWDELLERVVHVELDADSPIGKQYSDQWSVRAMPTYLLFNSDGQELGRLLGEQTAEDFFGPMAGWLDANNPLDTLRADAESGNTQAIAQVLDAYKARYDTSGLAWYAGLPEAARTAAKDDTAVQAAVARLELMKANDDDDAAGCIAAADGVFAGDLGCTDVYELAKLMHCTESSPAETRNAALAPLASRFQVFADQHVFGDGPACADERSNVLYTAEALDAIGQGEAAETLVSRAIDQLRPKIEPDPRKDRNQADNLRVYLAAAERQDELDAWQLKLIDAYPEDYVYAFRYGRSLVQRERYEDALPYLERAAKSAYGVNRLQVAEQRVKALLALDRADDARAVAATALKENGPWFPEEAGKLKGLLPA